MNPVFHVYVFPISGDICLMSSSLPLLLLSRFIINLREVDSPATNLSDSQHLSRFSIPNSRVPTMNDVVGNLGEPLDFVDYRIEDDEDLEQGSEQTDVDDTYDSPMLADVEAARPSSRDNGSSGATVGGHGAHFEEP